MSGLINKAKEVISGHKGENTHSTNSTQGYDSSATAGHGQHGTHDTHGTHGTHGTGATGTNYGQTGTGTTGYGNTTAGPHGSNVTNKLDPRVDSDRDNRNDPTSRVGGYGAQENYSGSGVNPTPSSGHGHSNTGTSGYGHTGTGTTGYGSQGTSTTAGPHSGNLANKLDPRVDSDRDNRNDPSSRVGGYGAQENYSGSGTNPGLSSGHGAYSSHTPTHGTTGLGTHTAGTGSGFGANSNLPGEPNTTAGYGTHGTVGGLEGQAAVHHATTHSGHGSSNHGSSNYGSSTTSGNTTTAGPHKSNLLNKLDPRVDSDLDGSKTH